MACAVPGVKASRLSGTGVTTRSALGSGIAARRVRGALTISPAHSARRASPTAAGLGVVPLLHGAEPLKPADRPGAGPEPVRRAGHDGAAAPRPGRQGS